MFGTQDLALFIASGLLLNIAPGPDTLLVVTRSASQGWRAGSAASLGICTGTLVHILAAALGVSALLATSATAFTLLKFVGAGYLMFVGIGLLLVRSTPRARARATLPRLPLRQVFAQGFLTNVLNPKVALFFLAFVPQFIGPQAPSKALAFIVLGCLFNINSLLWSHVLVVSTALASRHLRVSDGVSLWLNRLIGALFVSFGIKLALAARD